MNNIRKQHSQTGLKKEATNDYTIDYTKFDNFTNSS